MAASLGQAALARQALDPRPELVGADDRAQRRPGDGRVGRHERCVDADDEPELAVGQPVADAIGVARRAVDGMLCRRSSRRTSAPATTRRLDAAGRRRPAPRRRPHRTDRRPASGPGARHGGRRRGPPRCRTAGPRALAQRRSSPAPTGARRRRRSASRLVPPIRRAAPATSPSHQTIAPNGSGRAPAPPVTSRDASEVSSVRNARTNPAATRPPPSIAPSSQEPDRRAGREGAIGCTTSPCASGRRPPITIPSHRPAAVGPPSGQDPTGPPRRGAATHRRAQPLRLTASRTRTPVPLPRPARPAHPRPRYGGPIGSGG